MTTDIALTDEQISQILHSPGNIDYVIAETKEQRLALFARAIEQAVLQSPEVQRLREDSKRLDFFIAEECQIQSLTLGNGTKFRLGWPDDGEAQSEWYACPRAAIDAAMEKQP